MHREDKATDRHGQTGQRKEVNDDGATTRRKGLGDLFRNRF
jgi:hypothetical protein